MNILQINSSKTWAGGEAHLKDLVDGLKNKGHSVTVAVKEDIAARFKDSATQIEVLPLKNAIDLYSAYQLSQVIKQQDIDIIHAHSGVDYWIAAFARYLAQKGKIVATRHILVSLGTSFFHEKLYRSFDQFIAVSNRVQEKLNNTHSFLVNKNEVIHNGINISKFSGQDYNQEITELKKEFSLTDELVIGMVGTLCSRKNQKLLIKIANQFQEKKVKFLIVGEDFSDDNNYKQELQTMIKDLNLEEKVILAGFRKDIPQLMNLFDILAVPSRREAFGLVAVEGMAAKNAVVASNVDGLAEIIEDQSSGLLVESDNKDGWIKAFDKLINDKDLRNRLSNNAYQRAENKFSLATMVNKTEKIYFNLIN
ncbi:glycosyltransferase [Halanaerobacter jeridensis]|uniref:Glycosyltransferase involved in cell wall biosynthesis n=1 Tax=Halanaerobacter jeridensis TaxID=706427 RepID=A0A939BSA9_9FIRM|nr:glycosyltransferase involved in cell wall biosynthesis [Halanaerobacter jeridensis]